MEGITSVCPVFLLSLAHTGDTSDDPWADPEYQENPTMIHPTPASSNASLWYRWEEILYEGAVLRLTFLFPQCAASSVSQRGPCNLFSLLCSHIIIVVCIMFIIISIIVPGIYVMFMIIVHWVCCVHIYFASETVWLWASRVPILSTTQGCADSP